MDALHKELSRTKATLQSNKEKANDFEQQLKEVDELSQQRDSSLAILRRQLIEQEAISEVNFGGMAGHVL